MEIKVNVINEMKKLRSNTYSDAYSWVDELVQNCQRAKATHKSSSTKVHQGGMNLQQKQNLLLEKVSFPP